MANYSDFTQVSGESQRAGARAWARPKTPYDRYMEEEGLPLYRGIGIYDTRELPRTDWKRMGGKGSFIQLDGTDNKTGMYSLEIPSAGTTNPERHLYDEVFYVVEGRGSTEVWQEGSTKKHTFEWQAGGLFAIPMNVTHRLVNASSSPAILIGGTTAPSAFNTYGNSGFIFNCDYAFTDRYKGEDDYYRPKDDLKADPRMSRAMRVTNIIPDIATCDLPLDNQRSPGYRRVVPHMASGQFGMFVGEHSTGRYAMAHRAPGPGSAVLICIRGKGYTVTWPVEDGTHPWESGKGEVVEKQEYVAGGMVASNPGGTGWFHAHYGIAKEPLRLLVYSGANDSQVPVGRPDQLEVSGNQPIEQGGRTITYFKEDPYVREYYTKRLEAEGAQNTMPNWIYDREMDTEHVLAVGGP